MAEETGKVLVAKYTLDTRDFKAAFDKIKSMVKEANQMSKQQYAQNLTAQKEELAISKAVVQQKLDAVKKEFAESKKTLDLFSRKKAATVEEARERAKLAPSLRNQLETSKAELSVLQQKNQELREAAQRLALIDRLVKESARKGIQAAIPVPGKKVEPIISTGSGFAYSWEAQTKSAAKPDPEWLMLTQKASQRQKEEEEQKRREQESIRSRMAQIRQRSGMSQQMLPDFMLKKFFANVEAGTQQEAEAYQKLNQLRRKLIEQEKKSSSSSKGSAQRQTGILGRALQGLFRGGASGGIFAMATGVAVGGGELMMFQYAVNKLRQFAQHIQEVGRVADTEAQLFQALSAAMQGGQPAARAYVDELKKATLGMVDESKLMEMAVVGQRSRFGLSADEIVRFTQAAVKLSTTLHGQAGPAMAIEGMMRSLETGRAYSLAHAVGINAQQIMAYRTMRGLGVEGSQKQKFMAIMDEMMKKAEASAGPMNTLGEAMQREKVQSEELQHKIAQLIDQNPALAHLFDSITGAIEKAEDWLDQHGDQISQILTATGVMFSELASGIYHTVTTLFSAVKEVIKDTGIGWAVGKVIDKGRQADLEAEASQAQVMLLYEEHLLKQMKKVAPEVKKQSTVGLTVGGKTTQVPTPGRVLHIPGVKSGTTVADFEKAYAAQEGTVEGWKSYIKQIKDQAKRFGAGESMFTPPGYNPQATNVKFKYKKTGASDQTDQGVLEQNAQKQYQIDTDIAKRVTQAKKAELDIQMKNLEEEHQKEGLSDQEYLQRRKALIEKEQQNSITGAATELALHLKLIQKRHETDTQKELERKQAYQSFLDAKQEADEQYNSQAQALGFETTELKRQNENDDLEFHHQIVTEKLQREHDANEEDYQSGKITLDKKLKKDEEYYAKYAAAVALFYDKKAKIAGLSDTQMKDLRRQEFKELDDLSRKLLQGEGKAPQERIRLALETARERVSAAESAQSLVKERINAEHLPSAQAAPLEAAALSQVIKAQTGMVKALQDLLSERNKKGQLEIQPGSQQYIQLHNQLDQAVKSLANFGIQLENINHQALPQLAQQLGKVVGSFSERSKQATGGFFGILSQVMAPDIAENVHTGLGALTGLFHHGISKENGLTVLPLGSDRTKETLATGVSKIAQGIEPLVDGIGGLVHLMGNPNMTVGQSGMAGAGAGMELGKAASGVSAITNVLGKSLSAALPGIGAAIGAAIGIISGIFERAARRIADTIQNSIQAITLKFEEGTQNLTTTLSALEAQRQDMIEQLSNTKGGRKYLDQMLPQLNQQIAQLKEQQRQIISSFEANLGTMNLNEQIQSVGQQIDQIIQQWSQYINAGGNVATANEFLAKSFQSLHDSEFQQLNQDYQQAIQNALNYNNLLIQRQQLVQSEAEQEMSIMNQGVLVRQQTVAQSKAFQIGQLREQTDQQLDQINQQIAAAKYQLDAQQKIFDLSSTRIGLENQLLQAQYQYIDYQTQGIAALQQLLSQFSAVTGGMGITQALSALLNLTAVQGMNLVPVGLPTVSSPTPSSAPSTQDSSLPIMFNQYANRMARYGQYTNAVPTSGVPSSG